MTAPKKASAARRITLVQVKDVRIDPKARENFTLPARLRPLTTKREPARVSHVTFTTGAQTHWHHHHGVQWLWFTKGDGEVATRQGELVSCSPNDLVHTEPNVTHRHGAAPGRRAEHLAITVGSTCWESGEATKCDDCRH